MLITKAEAQKRAKERAGKASEAILKGLTAALDNYMGQPIVHNIGDPSEAVREHVLKTLHNAGWSVNARREHYDGDPREAAYTSYILEIS